MAIIDRRASGSSGSQNRKKLIGRIQDTLKQKVKEDFKTRSLTDVSGKEFKLPRTFKTPKISSDSPTGDGVGYNNKEFPVGGKFGIKKRGSGGGGADDSGGVEEELIIYITPEEYFDALFTGLKMPNLKKRSSDQEDTLHVRAGFTRTGVPAQLNMVKTIKQSLARKKALTGEIDREMSVLSEIEEPTEEEAARLAALLDKKGKLRFLDEVDLRYNNYAEMPKPKIKAVIFFVMDVSGSMSGDIIDLAKRYFFLCYMFINKIYNGVILEFVVYAGDAQRVTGQRFFSSSGGGGTNASTGYSLVEKIWEEEYGGEWNGYLFHSSDGDNSQYDNLLLKETLTRLSNALQFIAYCQVGYDSPNTLFEQIESLKSGVSNLEVTMANNDEEVMAAFLQTFHDRKEIL